MILYSYAKFNLYLEVVNRRKDNYHNLKTIFERIDLADKIILKNRLDAKIRIISDSPDIPKDKTNLAYRSAQILQNSLGIEKGVDITIIKHIPVGSGLGGGSSNAAFVLLGLNKLWKLNLTKNKLLSFAKKIGSDVPFFIYNCPFALGKAKGDEIKPLRSLRRAKFWHILVVPRIHVSTPLIYHNWDKTYGLNNEKARLTTPKYNVNILALALKRNDPVLIANALFNGLEPITAKIYPQIGLIRDKLRLLGLQSILMSGSGPAIFGITSSRKEAARIQRQLKREKIGQVFVTRTF